MANLRVTFKNETTLNGEICGPLTIWDMDLVEADEGMTPEGHRPYRYIPKGMISLGWHSRSMAEHLAEIVGVELEES